MVQGKFMWRVCSSARPSWYAPPVQPAARPLQIVNLNFVRFIGINTLSGLDELQ
jgi:hypothetical protein